MLKQDPVENGSAAYHGYWGLDFTTVDPHLGTDQDFADLVAKAHGLGLKVYLDVVVNHTADIVQLTGTSYTDAPYRDCHGKAFNPARYVTRHVPVPEGGDDAASAVRPAGRPARARSPRG